MYRNPFWLIFLGLIGIATVSYTFNTFLEIYNFQRLTTQIPISSINWSVNTITDENFTIQSHYSYFFKGINYQKEEIWNEHYLNTLTAEEKISELSKNIHRVWIDNSNPNYSALQKDFPFKQCVSMIFLCTICIYFFWLGYYVKNYIQINKIR